MIRSIRSREPVAYLRRAAVTMAAVGLVATACAGGTDDDAGAPSSADDGTTDADARTDDAQLTARAPGPEDTDDRRRCPEGQELFGPSEDVQEAPQRDDAAFPWRGDGAVAAEGFDVSEVVSGGPPPDGIPSIDAPCFESIESADEWLTDTSPVLRIDVNGDARAYPLGIMTQHEIVNDVVGGEPLVVTYCPLCNSGLAFHRTVDGQVLDFGTSGRLYRSNLVMYDRQTRSLWIQFTGRAVIGEPWVGTELERVSTALLAWSEFREAHPDGISLSRDTGFGTRDYTRNPYPGYEGSGSEFLYRGPTDDRLDPNERVVGLVGPTEQDPIAVPLTVLEEQRVVRADLAGAPVTVWWAPGASSALDTRDVSEGRDVGQTGSFRPVLDDGTELTFSVAPDDETRFVDDQTGSTWNLVGEAVAGDLAGTRLEEVPRDDTFWFVWFAFRPATEIVRGP